MVENITKIPFIQPIDRQRNCSSLPNKVLWGLYDELIDNTFSSPFATKCYQVRENGLTPFGKKRFDILSPSGNHCHYGYLGYLSLKVMALFGLVYCGKFAAVASLLAIGLAIKYYVRFNEDYYSVPIAEVGAQPLEPEVSLEQRQENLLKWTQKWMCDSYFHLFALGMTEASIIPSENLEDETFVKVFIGEECRDYPRSFLMQLPFFSALMRSGMSDVTKEGIRLTLAFPYTHGDLAHLQDRINSSNVSEWGDLEAFDFLCLGMRSESAPYVERVGAVQAAILNRELEAMNPYLQNLSNRSLAIAPGIKAGAYTLDFLPSISQINQLKEIQEVELRVPITIECLDSILRSEVIGNAQKHFYCNKVIQEFIEFLHDKRDAQIDILEMVISVIEKCPEAKNYITVLSLPTNVKFSSGLLPKLLAMLPSLYWLQIDLFSEKLVIEQEVGQRGPDFGDGHQALRVLSINQRFDQRQKKILEKLFPHLDVMENY